ncbi:MAG: penicillin acylase family protein [Candidatus Promineifilaceae bacterium]
MSRANKVLFSILGILITLVLIVAIVIYSKTRQPFPKVSGTIEAPGLEDTVEIYRDDYGIPHIYAANEHDLFFAQGYVHAQDRFWQMEWWRHIGQGRVSEIAGEGTVEIDKFIRTMGWNRLGANALAHFETEEPEYMDILEAYSAGVNAYIDANRDDLSLNMTVLGLVNEPWEIEPWTPLNTITWGVVMADDLSGNWGDEVDRAELIQQLGEAQVATLLPGYAYGERPVMVPTDAMPYLNSDNNNNPTSTTRIDWNNVQTSIIGAEPPNGFAFGSETFVGSNNWVISGEHTETGEPLLANDPHLGIQMPSIWYEAGLHAPGWDVVGFSFAGVPGIVVGHNSNIAWGVTNVGPDTQDLYIEKVNPNNPHQYEFMGEWQEMTVHEEVIKVNGGDDIVLEVLETQHGPIISDLVDGSKDVLAMRWTAQEPSRVLQSIILLNQAENYDDFRHALQYWDLPAQNVVYADVEGNIAYQMPGLIPLRQNGDGQLPVPGWTGEYEWEGWVPYDELPRLFNPEWGYIVTANHAVVDEDYPYLLAHDWADGDRGERITDLIQEAIEDGGISVEDIARIQSDSYAMLAESYQPLFQGLSSDDAQIQAMIERIRGWDLQERRESVPTALFEIFYMNLVNRVLADEVGEENVRSIYSVIFFHQLAKQPSAAWWDDVDTSPKETPTDIVLLALGDTQTWFEENVGGDINEWTWGTIHTATFVSAPLGQSGIGVIENIVNRGPFPADGGRSIVNANGWSWSEPAHVTGHPSMRMIVDFSDFDASQAVIPTGQSGHPYHKHYDDMIELWLNGQYHPMLFSQEVVEDAAADSLTLEPADE